MATTMPIANGATAHVNGSGPSSSRGGAPGPAKVSKNAKRRAKKRQEKAADPAAPTPTTSAADTNAGTVDDEMETAEDTIAQPSTSSLVDFAIPDPEDETYSQFKDIFARFQGQDDGPEGRSRAGPSSDPSKGDVIYSDDEAMSDSDATDDEGNKPSQTLSKRKQKKLSRLTVAELKQLVSKPEVVDWSDVTAADPTLLVSMKSTRNTVAVPPHWSQKRDYLQNKRGIEKPPYELPSYIADTGIGTMKDALREKEADQSLKTKTRERVQPKMGKLEVDYQKLYDAFFRFQTKPPLSIYGETYYEGKEFETKFKERKPGDLSQELKEALSIPPLAPPPWLIAQQRFGPPPSYPHLKIAGLNAPIPQGGQWGFHPGGWGRPPLDEFGQPLYGDVFGQVPESQMAYQEEPVERELFGELEPEEDEPEEEDSDQEGDSQGRATPDAEEGEDDQYPASGLETPGGMQSVTSTIPGGLETPDFVDLRKRGGTSTPANVNGTASVGPQQHKSLYQVVPETQGRVRGGLMGSERGYDVAGLGHPNAPVLGSEDAGGKRKAGSGHVDVSFDPSELEGMTEAELQARYDAVRKSQAANAGSGTTGAGGGEDLSLLREELSRKRRATEERRKDRGGEKKEKFKF